MLIQQMVTEGLSDAAARARVFMIDRYGLVTEGMQGLRDFQQVLAQKTTALEEWSYSGEYPTLNDVVNCAKPDVLIGVSGQPGLFTEEIVRNMGKHCEQPIIFPLSNPSRQVEARPEQVIEWTDGNVVLATGSPFKPVEYKGEFYSVAQCNNSYIFPGIGLGVLASKAKLISDGMLMAASNALAESSPLANLGTGDLLPSLGNIAQLSKEIAFAVGKVAIEEGLALHISDDKLLANIDATFWHAEYRPYKRVSI